MTKRLSSLVSLLALFGVPAWLNAQEAASPVDDPVKHVTEAVQKEFDAGLFPGAVVLIGTPDKVLLHEAFGFAHVEPKKVAMQKDSIFDVASVTKIVCTATAIGICKDRGLVDPDAAMTVYFPDHKGKGVDKISLRRLASHTSGFAEMPRVSFEGKFKGDALFERMLTHNPAWEVNSKYQYACRNIIYLSTIVERVTKKSFGEFCQEEIFNPLEMPDSRFNKIEPSDRVVPTHYPVLGESHNSDTRDAERAIGNAGLFTTANDLAHYCEMMINNGTRNGKKLLSPETIADFTKPNQLPQFIGRGFIFETDLKSRHRPTRMSDKAYGHSGNTGISVWIDPEKKVYTIVMTNRNHPRNEKFANGKEPTNSPRGIQQYKARGRIADAAMEAFGY